MILSRHKTVRLSYSIQSKYAPADLLLIPEMAIDYVILLTSKRNTLELLNLQFCSFP